MSVDIVVWEGARPVDDADAVATFDRLHKEFLDEGEAARPTDAIRDYVVTLLRRYPDLPDEDPEPTPGGPVGYRSVARERERTDRLRRR